MACTCPTCAFIRVYSYGQTGSGKTYTMGPTASAAFATAVDDFVGLVPRAVHAIFNEAEAQAASYDFNFRLSCIEVYLEELVDLLDPSRAGLQIRERETGETLLLGATELEVGSAAETLRALGSAVDSRRVRGTTANARSSRSHAVYTLMLEKVSKTPDDSSTTTRTSSVLNFVDLAGSERTKGVSGQSGQVREAIHINGGLLALGNVVAALSERRKRKKHVPYRDSKLTRLLKSALGGNSKTVMVLCVSPSDDCLGDSLNTLKYGTRAKAVRNTPIVNVNTDERDQEIRRMREEIDRLQENLIKQQDSNANMGTPPQTVQDLQELSRCIAPVVAGLQTILPQPAMRKLEDILQRQGMTPDPTDIEVNRSWGKTTSFSATASEQTPCEATPTETELLRAEVIRQRSAAAKMALELKEARSSLREDEAIFSAKLAEIEELRRDLAVLKHANSGDSRSSPQLESLEARTAEQGEWQMFTLGAPWRYDKSISTPLRSQTPNVDTSLLNLVRDARSDRWRSDNADDDVVLFGDVPETSPKEKGTPQQIDAQLSAGIASAVDHLVVEEKIQVEQQKLSHLQSQQWDLGVLRDSLHLQRLRESRLGAVLPADGEPISDPPATDDAVDRKIAQIDCQLQLVLDDMQSTEAEIEFRESKLESAAKVNRQTRASTAVTVNKLVESTVASCNRRDLVDLLKKFVLQAVDTKHAEISLCARQEHDEAERDRLKQTICELEEAATRLTNEKESLVSQLRYENQSLRKELASLRNTVRARAPPNEKVKDVDAEAKMAELAKSLYYYKKRSRELRRMLEAVQGTGHVSKSANEEVPPDTQIQATTKLPKARRGTYTITETQNPAAAH